MAQKWKAFRLVLFLATSVFLIGALRIGDSLGAAAAGMTRNNSGGGVTVKVTYPHSQGADGIHFELVLDTHSVNLDAYDLKALSLLRDDTGGNYQPTQVENKGSGHHREITIVFPKASPSAKRLELVIKDVAGIKGRSFFWDLE